MGIFEGFFQWISVIDVDPDFTWQPSYLYRGQGVSYVAALGEAKTTGPSFFSEKVFNFVHIQGRILNTVPPTWRITKRTYRIVDNITEDPASENPIVQSVTIPETNTFFGPGDRLYNITLLDGSLPPPYSHLSYEVDPEYDTDGIQYLLEGFPANDRGDYLSFFIFNQTGNYNSSYEWTVRATPLGFFKAKVNTWGPVELISGASVPPLIISNYDQPFYSLPTNIAPTVVVATTPTRPTAADLKAMVASEATALDTPTTFELELAETLKDLYRIDYKRSIRINAPLPSDVDFEYKTNEMFRDGDTSTTETMEYRKVGALTSKKNNTIGTSFSGQYPIPEYGGSKSYSRLDPYVLSGIVYKKWTETGSMGTEYILHIPGIVEYFVLTTDPDDFPLFFNFTSDTTVSYVIPKQQWTRTLEIKNRFGSVITTIPITIYKQGQNLNHANMVPYLMQGRYKHYYSFDGYVSKYSGNLCLAGTDPYMNYLGMSFFVAPYSASNWEIAISMLDLNGQYTDSLTISDQFNYSNAFSSGARMYKLSFRLMMNIV